MKRIYYLLVTGTLAVLFISLVPTAQAYDNLSSSGTRMVSGNLVMDATVGQPAVGVSGELISGFLGFKAAPKFVAGDADGSGTISIADAIVIINYVFGGGTPPKPLAAGDADCSGSLTIGDAVFIINYIFAGGPAPDYCP